MSYFHRECLSCLIFTENAYPVFRRQSTGLIMQPTVAAIKLQNENRNARALTKEAVLAEAKSSITNRGVHPTTLLVLAHCKLQFGKYSGQKFKWLLENDLGYAVYLLSSIESEKAYATPLSQNKQLFIKYTSNIKEMSVEVEKYRKRKKLKASPAAALSLTWDSEAEDDETFHHAALLAEGQIHTGGPHFNQYLQ